ncbi:MAG: sensor histidine kinase [Candidatus Kapaibacterium sp.]
MFEPKTSNDRPPQLTLKGITIVSLCWLCYATITAGFIESGSSVPFQFLLFGQIVASAILAIYTLPIWLLLVQRLHSAHWGTKLSLHIAIAPIYGLATYYSIEGFYLLAGFLDAVAAIRQNQFWILLGNIMLYALQFALFHIIVEVRRSRQREEQAAKLTILAREQELQALRSQLNPHFLFNVLHSINATIGIDPEKAREMLTRLSDLLRYILDSGKHRFLPLGRELDVVEAYLSLEQVRFGDRLNVRFDVDDTLLSIPVPPMILQPLVENSVKHGVAMSEASESISIVAHRLEGRVVLIVENTTNGIESATETHEGSKIGVENINKRLAVLYGEDSSVVIRKGDGATQVSLTIPLSNNLTI